MGIFVKVSDPIFSVLEINGTSFQTTVSSRVAAVLMTPLASTTASLTPLQIYLYVGSAVTLKAALKDPPPIGEVVTQALRNPGVAIHDRAVNFLACVSGRTLWFAMQQFASSDYLFRPIYSDKAWEILISALGMAEDAYTPHIVNYIKTLRKDRNPVKRLAAFDALEMLQP